MKKLLFICSMMVVALTASAQFTEFRSIYSTPQPSYTPSPGYGVPFATYESLQSRQQARPRMQEVTLRGYYKNGNDWYSTPIRVGVIGDEVRLLSAKTQYGWSNCGSKASSVGAWDSEEIRDNFNYKAYTTIYGTIYF